MEGYFVLAEYSSNINSVIKQTFQSMQRIKLTCFNSSLNYLIFGATSGGIYIFKRDPCQFIKLIPSKEGSASLVAISKDEHNVAVATSRGLILVLQNFLEDSSKYQVFGEHETRNVTYFKWHKSELYVGDDRGKVSVVSVTNALFQTTKSIFQLPTATLMTLDSAILQIDTYRSFLLISTKTKTYLCNTEQERFIQIGKKLRDGYFGACFSNNHCDGDEITISQSTKSTYESVNEFSGCTDSNTKIYCARPGARLWEVSFDARVLVTYQFKGALKAESAKVLVIGCEEESVLQTTQSQGPVGDFNFQKVYCVCDRFVLTYDSDKLYIFDPVESQLMFWTGFGCGIRDVAFVNDQFYVWKDNLEISVLSVLQLETLILSTLYKKQFYLCTEICLEYRETILKLLESSKKLYLLSALATKITDNDLLAKLGPIFDKIKQTNEKVFKGPQKSSHIVVVDNLYSDVVKPPVIIIDDKNKDLKLMLKQYNLNKTHKTIDIPEVSNLLNNFNGGQLFILFKQFAEYVEAELNEDSISWCQNQYLKQISQRNVSVKDLDQESFEFLTEAVTKANNLINFSCPCGFPLPKCHKNAPNFYKTALDLFNSRRIDTEKLLKSIPYLWRYKIKTEIYGLNLPALIQYSNLALFKEHALSLVYDNWHDVLGYFVKLNKSACLNCDRKIDINSALTWTEVAKVIVQSLGSKNCIKILEKYEKFIPNGALDAGFYQICIFAHSVNNDNKVKTDVPFRFYEELNKEALGQLQQCMAKHFKRKYTSKATTHYEFVPEKSGLCHLCKLPLKSDILYDCVTLKTCSHNFHKFCYDRNDGSCNICN